MTGWAPTHPRVQISATPPLRRGETRPRSGRRRDRNGIGGVRWRRLRRLELRLHRRHDLYADDFVHRKLAGARERGEGVLLLKVHYNGCVGVIEKVPV